MAHSALSQIAERAAVRARTIDPETLIARDRLLSRHTSLKIGGLADCFAEPTSLAEVAALVAYAQERELRWMVLGNGTNILFPDEGYRGLIIHLGRKLGGRCLDEDLLTAQAGAGLGATMGYLQAHGFYDFDGLIGIPGTIGGALAMNAGNRETTIADALACVTVLTETGDLLTLSRDACQFGYRRSLFRDRPWVILEGRFRLGGGRRFDPQAIMARRRIVQPLRQPSAGCVFANPPGPLTAGRLLDRAGLRGFRCGGAMISPVHANFFLNCGGATAADLLNLIDIAREKVYKEFGVELRLELVVVSN